MCAAGYYAKFKSDKADCAPPPPRKVANMIDSVSISAQSKMGKLPQEFQV